MIEEVLSRIAGQIMALDEETLTALLPRYKERMLAFAPTRQWEEAMLIYFIINGVRTKNIQFNEKIKKYMEMDEKGETSGPHIRPRLRLVASNAEAGEDQAEGDAPEKKDD